MTNCARRPARVRLRYTLRDMLVLVGLFALALAFRQMLWPVCLIAVGPICGAVIGRARRDEGVTGGILGGTFSFPGIVAVHYIYMWCLGHVRAGDLVLFLVLFLTAALFGAVVGLAIGCIVEIVANLMDDLSTRQNRVIEPVANGNLFDREQTRMTPNE